MLHITKNNFFQYQSVLSSSKNLTENKRLKKRFNYNFIVEYYYEERNAIINIKSPLLLSRTGGSTSFLNIKKTSIIKTRSMMSQRVIARSINSLNNVPMITRGYACVHGGDFKHNAKKPLVKDTDLTPKHKKVVETTCPQTECKKINCADSAAPAICSRTPTQNKATIPPTKQGFKTTLKGNTTSHVPQGKVKIVIDPHVNYNGQLKAQEMVKETMDVTIDSKDIKVDLNVTSYLQQQDHHDAITK